MLSSTHVESFCFSRTHVMLCPVVNDLFRRHKRTTRVSHNKTAAGEHSVVSPDNPSVCCICIIYVKTDITNELQIYTSEVPAGPSGRAV